MSSTINELCGLHFVFSPPRFSFPHLLNKSVQLADAGLANWKYIGSSVEYIFFDSWRKLITTERSREGSDASQESQINMILMTFLKAQLH